MSINIKLKGNTESDEYKAALVLKQIFERALPKDIGGEILIYTNATLFGQKTKDLDIVVVGKFDKYFLNINSKTTYKDENGKMCTDEVRNRRVYINDFCFVIELKQQTAGDLWLDGPELFVKYNEKKHSVTLQSEGQKYSLSNFFNDRLNISPHVYNFIWLRNVSQASIQQLVNGDGINNSLKHNYLPTNFSLEYLLNLAVIQKIPWTSDPNGKNASFSSFFGKSFDAEAVDSIFEVFNKVKKGMGDMTRKKISYITRKFLKDQNYAKAIGDKLIIMQGRAGTGKTIKLLNIACDLAKNKGARCLILTFNNALVGDIKRMIALAEIPDKPDSYSVGIRTLDSFFCEILKGFDIGVVMDGQATFVKDYLTKKEKYLEELYNYIDQGAINDKDMQNLMKSNHDAIAWDYILIDEGQDWSELEKKLIFKIFGFKNVIVADGVDQLIRSQKKCIWSKNLKLTDDFEQTFTKKGLRQKVNLVNFVNYFAEEIHANWNIEPKEDMIGGKIIVSLKPYSGTIHQGQLKRVRDSGEGAYEMLMLVPPSLVDQELVENKYIPNKKEINNYFKNRDAFKKDGINIWDGTSRDLRSEYVVDPEQHRLLQYDSCRGLEGWCVVCLDFDDFIEYKRKTFKKEEGTGQFEWDLIEDRERFAKLWSLIPLTRAIDTLVITIRDKDSEICKVLKKIHEEHLDYVEWIE